MSASQIHADHPYGVEVGPRLLLAREPAPTVG